MSETFLYIEDQPISRATFQKHVKEKLEAFKSQKQVLLQTTDLLSLYASLIAAQELKISLYLCPPSLEIAKLKIPLTEGSFLGIFTSATTGEPKMALHQWETITSSAAYVPLALHNQTWLLSYAPWGYAGLQVFFSAYYSHGALYFAENHFEQICPGLLKYHVSIISATPTFWRLLISSWPADLSLPTLIQATLGGEIVDQTILDLIESFFHPQNLTHIYASTEAGTAIVVSDRQAGFPKTFLLKKGKNGTELRISAEHELEVKSPKSMTGYTNAWIATGDLVEEKGERIYFVGRKDGRINTGGRKVSPEEIEQALKALPEIEDCLVYEKKSPIVGALIAAEVLMAPGQLFDESLLKKKLKPLLADYKIPHLIRRVNHFVLSSNGKKIRQNS